MLRCIQQVFPVEASEPKGLASGITLKPYQVPPELATARLALLACLEWRWHHCVSRVAALNALQ